MIIIQAILESFRSLKDKTLKLTFETQEVNPSQISTIHENFQRFGYLVFSVKMLNDEQLNEIENATMDFDRNKTPSKRLRNVLYINYEKDNEGYTDFNNYYISKMELIIQHYKNKLD